MDKKFTPIRSLPAAEQLDEDCAAIEAIIRKYKHTNYGVEGVASDKNLVSCEIESAKNDLDDAIESLTTAARLIRRMQA